MGTAHVQGPLWGARAQDWAEAQEPAWNSVYREVMALVGANSAKKVFDCGCGAGGALVVARTCGSDVAGLDASTALVEIARRRLPGARIEIGDMEELPVDDGVFDIVTGINSFQFAGDIVRALAEARRILKPGGRLLMLVWGRKENCDVISAIMPAIISLLPTAPSAGSPPPIFSDPGVMENFMKKAGLSPTVGGDFDRQLVFPDIDTALRAFGAAAPCVRAAAYVGEKMLHGTLREKLHPFLQVGGSLVLTNRFRYAIGERS